MTRSRAHQLGHKTGVTHANQLPPEVKGLSVKLVSETEQDYLNNVVQTVAADLLERIDATRSRGADRLNVRSLSRSYIHSVGIVELEGTNRRCFAKAKKELYVGQDLRAEADFLSRIAPLITAQNPLLRSPAVIGYYGEQNLLMMEWIDGHSLKEHLFDFRYRGQKDMARSLRLAGEWLGRLHRLSRQAKSSNPIDDFLEYFESSFIADFFRRHSLETYHSEILKSIDIRRQRNPDFRRNLSMTHGEFTPLHVLVSGQGIYVVDFGNSRPGFPLEDAALFIGFWDSLMPWRLGMGTLRLGAEDPKKLFLDSYFKAADEHFGVADSVLMRWLRIKAFLRLLTSWNEKMSSVPRVVQTSFWNYWFLPRFVSACREELSNLNKAPTLLADEIVELQPEHVANRSA